MDSDRNARLIDACGRGLTGACVMVGTSYQYIWQLTYNPLLFSLPSRYSDNQPSPRPFHDFVEGNRFQQ